MPINPRNTEIRRICRLAPVIPVLVVENTGHAEPLARALICGGLPALEVTLRTPAALEVIKAMSQVPGAVVGAGTLLTSADVIAAKAAGAQFGVSPGATDHLIAACEDNDLPLLAGVSTASEAMSLLEKGYDIAKFFPAEAAGGVSFLKALAGPLPNMHFCPTGGVNPQNVNDYLSLPNVLCAGGSWLAPRSLLEEENWGEIERLAITAAA